MNTLLIRAEGMVWGDSKSGVAQQQKITPTWWATCAEDHAGFQCCQWRTGIRSHSLHRLTNTGKVRTALRQKERMSNLQLSSLGEFVPWRFFFFSGCCIHAILCKLRRFCLWKLLMISSWWNTHTRPSGTHGHATVRVTEITSFPPVPRCAHWSPKKIHKCAGVSYS